MAVAVTDSRARFAVMFLDFDRFKLINDSMGHGAGDKLLITAAMRLKACLRPTDLVYGFEALARWTWTQVSTERRRTSRERCS